jgi:hypothetical protein
MSGAIADREIYADGRTYAEHCAWMDSLNEDENAILYTPVGHRYSLVLISEAKRWLAHELSAEHRLKFLEFLDRCTGTFTADMIAQVEPMSDEAYEMVKEARKLGPGKSLDVLASWEVFNAFVALNPSLLTAIKMKPGHQYRRNGAANLN